MNHCLQNCNLVMDHNLNGYGHILGNDPDMMVDGILQALVVQLECLLSPFAN
ncbi:hypothetical protein QSV37_17575 [Acinetobacter sp. VNK23]|uniref:hypothetical protein n=1 Tax=Acinetobacter thutiue TaxID=2998078 RepID=UPI0025791712|nr:hypothetical protein [Acinetobacter thutiue]MDM1022085.1 hypothetical protein [Acinetobacter thutiue]